MSKSLDFWYEQADKLKDTPQVIDIREAQKKLELSSTSHVIYYLKQMQKIGLVYHEKRGTSGKWFFRHNPGKHE